MSRTFDYLFYPKKPKNYKSGPVTLYLRITVDGDRKEAATSLEIDPNNWEYGKMKGYKEDSKTFNTSVSNLVTELYKCYNRLLQNDKDITAESLRNAFTGKGERTRYFIEIFKEHNKSMEKLIGKDFEKPTLTKYNTTYDHLLTFLKWKFNLTDISLGALDYEFITDFEFYLKTERNIGHNTTAKYINNTRKVVNECVNKKWLKTDPFFDYSITADPVDPIFLFQEELDLIIDKEFKLPRLALVRDLFVFSCYTGFAYIEVRNLTLNNVAIGIDKQKWIFTNRQKNKIPSHVPLLAPALEIIEKYKNHPSTLIKGRLLPILSNQKMNAYLKEIADLCGITKELTFHCARHTFATTVTLSNDVPIESVSKMLGHKKIQTTQHYARVLDKKVSCDMEKLRLKLGEKGAQSVNNISTAI